MTELKEKSAERMKKSIREMSAYSRGWFAGICEAWAMMAEANGTGAQSPEKEAAQK